MVCFAGSGHTLWQYRVPDKNGELTKSYASDFHVHGQEARKIRVLKQIEGVEDLLNLKTTMERSKSQHIREDRNFDRLPVSSWSDPSGRVVLLGDGKLLHSCSPCPTIWTHKFLLFSCFLFRGESLEVILKLPLSKQSSMLVSWHQVYTRFSYY